MNKELKERILNFLSRERIDWASTKMITQNLFSKYNHETFYSVSKVLWELHREGKVEYENRHPDTIYILKGSWYYWRKKNETTTYNNKQDRHIYRN